MRFKTIQDELSRLSVVIYLVCVFLYYWYFVLMLSCIRENGEKVSFAVCSIYINKVNLMYNMRLKSISSRTGVNSTRFSIHPNQNTIIFRIAFCHKSKLFFFFRFTLQSYYVRYAKSFNKNKKKRPLIHEVHGVHASPIKFMDFKHEVYAMRYLQIQFHRYKFPI